jgi:hypothetical protein
MWRRLTTKADHNGSRHGPIQADELVAQCQVSDCLRQARCTLQPGGQGESCPGALCRPSGPDGEGQARGQARRARGDPPEFNALPVGLVDGYRLAIQLVEHGIFLGGNAK